MPLVLRALDDPPFQHLDLYRGEFFARRGGRHAFFNIMLCDSADELALGRLAGNDDRFDGPLAGIESQFTLTLGEVGTVALEAVLRQDRPHVAVEVHPLGGGERGQ